MEQNGSGVISQSDLMVKLAQAKKVMNKVESGSIKSTKINESRFNDDDDNYDDIYNQPQFLSEDAMASVSTKQHPYSVDKINQSKLPDAIKQAMIKTPIIQPDISLSDGIDMNIIKGAKRLIEQENKELRSKNPQQQPNKQQTSRPQSSVDLSTLIPIMENMIRKVMDEKLNQILSAQQTQTINENLVLKVGDSIFKGKITGVNKAK